MTMTTTHSRLRAIYKWLISLFPADYQAQVGESMLDTFDDLRRAGASWLDLYADICLHLLKERLMQSNLTYLVVAIAAVLCGSLARVLDLQVPGSVYLAWGALALLLGALQRDSRTLQISAALFGLLLAFSFLLPKLGAAPDPRGYLVVMALAGVAAAAASLLAANAGFWARLRLQRH